MSFVTTSTFFSPILGILLAVAVLTVIVVVIASAVRAGRAHAVAYFVFGLSLVTLATAVSMAGVVTHSVSELVGPAPQSIDTGTSGFPCPPPSGSTSPSTPPPNTLPSPGSALRPPAAVPGSNGASGLSAFCQSIENAQASSGDGGIVSGSTTDLVAPTDDTNHFISVSVLAGLFGVAAAIGYLLLWRRGRTMVMEIGLDQPPLGRLPVTYGYLIAGLAVLSLLVFAPLAADNIFRAIAPGVNETSGHADGVRNLITFLVLSGLTAVILLYHLRYLSSLGVTWSPGRIEAEPDDPESRTES
ncbi:MAG TPA: hypothetical protein VFZ97_06620 [Acidimicrobiales bacterium]